MRPLHFGTDVLVPDHAGWRRERMPQMRPVAYFQLPPDWVCEVSSPSTATIDRYRKLQVYARKAIPSGSSIHWSRRSKSFLGDLFVSRDHGAAL
jgi:Uma2 family endonuclease